VARAYDAGTRIGVSQLMRHPHVTRHRNPSHTDIRVRAMGVSWNGQARTGVRADCGDLGAYVMATVETHPKDAEYGWHRGVPP
jgi:hypothetical protein